MADFKALREAFDRSARIYESTLLTFHGVEGFDVYNCSIPFEHQGKQYIYGRVERRDEWARSWVRLFEKTGEDDYTLEQNSMIYQLEDPYISVIDGELVLGGTHVRYTQGRIDAFYGYFYKGTDLENLYYFTSGPHMMKDIRLIQLQDKRIGVFSRPRSKEIEEKYGSASVIGFAVIDNLMELNADIIENAPVIGNLFGEGEWGGCNQCYLLDSGKIGVIAHKSYQELDEKGELHKAVYTNAAFVFDPVTHEATEPKIIATRSSFPAAAPKYPQLSDCAFTSGIVLRDDGKVDLYSGLGDTFEGRAVIDYPFAGYGSIIR